MKAKDDEHEFVRNIAIEELNILSKSSQELFEFFCSIVRQDPFRRKYDREKNPRQSALEILMKSYALYPERIESLCNRAANDPDEKLSQWAQKQLEKLKVQNSELKVEGEEEA